MSNKYVIAESEKWLNRIEIVLVAAGIYFLNKIYVSGLHIRCIINDILTMIILRKNETSRYKSAN